MIAMMMVLLFGFCVISGVLDILTRARRASVAVRRECFARRSVAFRGRRCEFIHEKSIAIVSAAVGAVKPIVGDTKISDVVHMFVLAYTVRK
jgi:hypothetical protein